MTNENLKSRFRPFTCSCHFSSSQLEALIYLFFTDDKMARQDCRKGKGMSSCVCIVLISKRCITMMQVTYIVGALAKLRNANISFLMSVRLSVRVEQFLSQGDGFSLNLLSQAFKSVEKIKLH
jgi:hypothetical protein